MGFAGRAQVEIRTIEAMPSNTADGRFTTLFAVYATMLVRLASCVFLGDVVQKPFEPLTRLSWSTVYSLEIFGGRKVHDSTFGTRDLVRCVGTAAQELDDCFVDDEYVDMPQDRCDLVTASPDLVFVSGREGVREAFES